MVTQIDTTFKMGCMAAVGYGAGIVLKTDPKVMALAWLGGEIALQVLKNVHHLPLPKVIAGSFMSFSLRSHEIIENSIRSHLITVGAFVTSSILIDKLATLFDKLCRAARNSNSSANLQGRIREMEMHVEEVSDDSDDEVEEVEYRQQNEYPTTQPLAFPTPNYRTHYERR